MQGRLRNERLSVKIDSECAHCGQNIHLAFDSELAWSVGENNPDIDWGHFKGTNIIHDY